MVCLKLMCDLLVLHPYFNYSQNIAQLLVLYLNNPKPEVRSIVSKCLSQIFREDKKGELSLFIVRKINLLVKSRTNAVHSEAVSVFLTLRIKDVNLDQEKEAELREKKFQTRRQKLLSMSKKERKASKRLEQLGKELLETKAEENKQTKHKTLTEVIKVVFTVYSRILKNDPTSKLLWRASQSE
ncbi:nucleolar complex protein 3 homolog [Nilaparvata lugens]|uniref:nucleolar complex protein 3 homolog n=1 Tax=Nilaparvata lugens TaxID=108931 RepID=UPI00193D621C|nr:nucleolar complex protein 3 homolog [Nilaparvata lugens]